MNIELCIPAVADGIHCLDFYLQNLGALASQPVKVTVSYHTDADLAAVRAMRNQPDDVVQAPAYSRGPFVASANHSSAINVLAQKAMGDIVIFSDYDMAFLKKGWDDDIRDVLKVHDFFGVPYAPLELGFAKDPTDGQAPWIAMQKMRKYQGIPNLSFFAIRAASLHRILKDGPVTRFDDFLNADNLPFRFVHTHELADELNLPLGSLNWMDTGHEVTSFPKKYGMTHQALEYVFAKDSEVFTHKFLLAQLRDIFKPEFFYLKGKPYLFHFKKGTMKAKIGGDVNFFDYFKIDVKNYIKGQL